MPVRKYKPTTNGLRNMSVLSFEEITTDTPEKSLLVSLNKKVDVMQVVKSQFAIKVEELKENIV